MHHITHDDLAGLASSQQLCHRRTLHHTLNVTAVAQPAPSPCPLSSRCCPGPCCNIDRVKEAAGRVDILVLCAAIAGKPYKLSPQVSTQCIHVPRSASLREWIAL